MAKTRPNAKKDRKRDKSTLNRIVATPSKSSPRSASPQALLLKATSRLQEGAVDESVVLAKQALSAAESDTEATLAALNLLGEVHVELGDLDVARGYFLQAAQVDEKDPQGEVKGLHPDTFLWLAQLSDEGGKDSVRWFEKGAVRLRTQIQALLDKKLDAASQALLEENQRKLSIALCSVVEVYMTDLSWEKDAEETCEKLVTEATMVSPKIAEPWQTLANVRISQERIEDAKEALKRSLELWRDLPPDDAAIPDFPTRVSLARLLMEAGMEDDALEVLERLVLEDDSSIEVWYLGGWGLYILGEKQREASKRQADVEGESQHWQLSWISSQQWLKQCLTLYEQQDYEDERLGSHAQELVAILDKEVGGQVLPDDVDDADDWQDESESGEDEEMAVA